MSNIFNTSKYTRWYFSIIQNAQCRDKNLFAAEKHHIHPKSLGGSNHISNLVKLSYREHYICHLLLTRMCLNNKHKQKMWYALWLLSNKSTKIKSRTYERQKATFISLISGPNSPLYAHNSYMFGVPKSEEVRAKIAYTRKTNQVGVGPKNGMYSRKHSCGAKQRMGATKKLRWCEQRRQGAISANPKSRRVQCDAGHIFPSLSEAGRHYGFVGNTAPRKRIREGVWKYL